MKLAKKETHYLRPSQLLAVLKNRIHQKAVLIVNYPDDINGKLHGASS